MTCLICKQGETESGFVTVTLERDGTTLVFKQVPAQVCQNCGEAYVDESTAIQLMAAADAAVQAGIQVEIRTFTAA